MGNPFIKKTPGFINLGVGFINLRLTGVRGKPKLELGRRVSVPTTVLIEEPPGFKDQKINYL